MSVCLYVFGVFIWCVYLVCLFGVCLIGYKFLSNDISFVFLCRLGGDLVTIRTWGTNYFMYRMARYFDRSDRVFWIGKLYAPLSLLI